MSTEPDNLVLMQLRSIRLEVSQLRTDVHDLRSRMFEHEERQILEAQTRQRHEERLAELHVSLDRLNIRLGLSDGS